MSPGELCNLGNLKLYDPLQTACYATMNASIRKNSPGLPSLRITVSSVSECRKSVKLQINTPIQELAEKSRAKNACFGM